jgi:hypothetical protein
MFHRCNIRLALCAMMLFLIACGSGSPLDPLAPSKEDSAIENALKGKTLYLLTENIHEIVYWRLKADGHYEFRQTAPIQYRFYEKGIWWIRDGTLFCERTEGSTWHNGESHDMDPKPFTVQINIVGPSIERAHWAVIHGHEYRIANEEEWRKISSNFFTEEE